MKVTVLTPLLLSHLQARSGGTSLEDRWNHAQKKLDKLRAEDAIGAAVQSMGRCVRSPYVPGAVFLIGGELVSHNEAFPVPIKWGMQMPGALFSETQFRNPDANIQALLGRYRGFLSHLQAAEIGPYSRVPLVDPPSHFANPQEGQGAGGDRVGEEEEDPLWGF